MKNLTHMLRTGIAILLAVLVSGVGSVAASQATDPAFYESEFTGREIEITDPTFVIEDAEIQNYAHGDGEVISISADATGTSIEISFFDDEDTPEQTVETYLESLSIASQEFEIIDQGIAGEHHYALAMITYGGVEIAFYIQVIEDVDGNVDQMETILVGDAFLEADLTAAQEGITIDGFGFLENLDAQTLLDVWAGDGSLSDDTGTASPESSDDTDATATTDASESVTLPGSGAVVSLNGDDVEFSSEVSSTGPVDSVNIQGDSFTVMAGVGETGDSADVVLEDFVTGFQTAATDTEVVQSETDSEVSWSLLSVGPAGAYDYTLVVADTISVSGYETVYAIAFDADTAQESLNVIQEQITIDGEPALSSIDIDDILSYIEDGGEDVGDTDVATAEATDEATEEADDDQSGDPRTDARIPAGTEETDDEDTTGNTSETNNSGDEEDVDTTAIADDEDDTTTTTGEADGLTDSSWDGGVLGHLIEWDEGFWFVDPSAEGHLVASEESQSDNIVLLNEDTPEVTFFQISIYGNSEFTPADYRAEWESEEYLAGLAGFDSEAEVLDSRSRGGSVAVVFLITDPDGSEYIVLRQASVLENGDVLVATVDTTASEFQSHYEHALEVTIDGDPVFVVLSSSQLERSLQP